MAAAMISPFRSALAEPPSHLVQSSTMRDRPSNVAATIKASDDTAAILRKKVTEPFRPVLVVLAGQEVGLRVVVDHTLLVGRDAAADLPLSDALVSWHHALIEDRGDGWALKDLGSTNGVRVNDQAGTEFALAQGDRIRFGDTVVRFELQDRLEQDYNEFVERMLNVDDLSGLLVRRAFDHELGLMIEAARAAAGSVGLLVMDLDGVKQINDTHGHLFGAYAIGEAGRVIGRVLKKRGIASRFGGDEFLAAVPGFDAAAAAAVAEEIRAAVAKHHFEREGAVLKPTISIGVAAYPADAATAEALFQHGDEALYRAKQAGKNRVCR
jgi:two-component system cell cycle response regulator